MTKQIKAIKETVVLDLDPAMVTEGKALAKIWTARERAEAKRFDGDILVGGFDNRLGKLLVSVYATLEDGKYIPKATAKAYGLDKIDSQRKSDARTWEDMGEANRTLLIEEYPAIKSLQRLVAKYAAMMKEESEGEDEGEGEGEDEGGGDNNITLDQVLALIATSDLSPADYATIAKASVAKAKGQASSEDDTKRAAINALKIAS